MNTRNPWKITAIALAVVCLFLLLFGCDAAVTPGPTGPVAIGPPSSPTNPSTPGTTAPEDPATPPTSGAPSYLIVENELGDSIAVRAGATVGVGLTRDVESRIRIAADRRYAVIVGMEGAVCDRGTAAIVGIVDDGTAGNSVKGDLAGAVRGVSYPAVSPTEARAMLRGSTGRDLTTAEDFTAWFDSACTLLAWWVEGPRVYDFAVRVRGLAAGESLARSQFELVDWPGADFRWTAFTGLKVVP